MKKLIFPVIIISALALVGCQTAAPDNKIENTKSEIQAIDKISKSQAGNFTVDFKTNPQTVRANEPAELAFTVKNARGETVKNLAIVHEKPMHLLVVSEDLSEFYHLHPEAQIDGSYKVSHSFPNGGNYRLYADLTPPDNAQTVQDFSLRVSGDERQTDDLKRDEKLEKTIGDLRVVLKPDGDLIANKEMRLDFQTFDRATNKPAIDLENYLGAKAHFVVISQDLERFVHAHSLSNDNVKGAVKGAQHSHETNSLREEIPQAHGEKLNGVESESIVSAHVVFPQTGIYKIFAQFQRAGQVVTVPYVVEIKAGAEEKPIDLSKVEFPAGAIKIIVGKDGFIPNEISFKQGEPLKLAFYRSDAENCGSEVVFQNLNITKKLPVGKVVLIDVPTDKNGEFAFACGMNMMKGKIVVQ